MHDTSVQQYLDIASNEMAHVEHVPRFVLMESTGLRVPPWGCVSRSLHLQQPLVSGNVEASGVKQKKEQILDPNPLLRV